MPSTCPETSAAASDSSQTTTGATLAGSSGSNSPGKVRSPKAPSVIRVRAPGAIALTRTPYRASSSAVITLKAATPALAAP
jgi:hypothetical protein